MKVVENLFKIGLKNYLKKLMVKNSFIEKTYVVGTHWNCLYASMRQFQCVPTIYVTKNKEENYFLSIMPIVFTSFKHPKLPISIKIPVTLSLIVYICMTAISSNSSS